MLQAEIWTIIQTKEGCAVLLRPLTKNIVVPIFTGQLEIQSIIIGRENMHLPRPLTHDLILNFMDSLKLTLDRVEIHNLIDNTFHARIIVTGRDYAGENPLALDCRPSDALGLAARKKCPILLSPALVRQAGISLDIFSDVLDVGVTPSEEKRRSLMRQLSTAVEEEEYEKAAKIRDMLKELESGS